MANTLVRSNRQLMDNSITFAKMLQTNFLLGTTWTLSASNDAVLEGLADPTGANQPATKSYVDGLVNSSMKAPDGFATTTTADYPSDYKGTGSVGEGDTFYVTDVTNGTTVGSAEVNLGDMLVALVDNPGNTDSNWVIIESNRDQATDTVLGVVELATQTEVDAGTDTSRVITPATLAGYIASQGINKSAGAGMTEDASHAFNVIASDASLVINTDDMAVQVGNTNGTTLTVTATGLELPTAISFNNDFSLSTGANNLTLQTGGTFTIDTGATANQAVLTAQPDGTVNLAIATTKYVDDSISSTTEVYNELPTVTDGNANVTLANTPTAGTERVYLNGVRQAPGAGNDYTISGATVTFSSALATGDIVVVDYKY